MFAYGKELVIYSASTISSIDMIVSILMPDHDRSFGTELLSKKYPLSSTRLEGRGQTQAHIRIKAAKGRAKYRGLHLDTLTITETSHCKLTRDVSCNRQQSDRCGSL